MAVCIDHLSGDRRVVGRVNCIWNGHDLGAPCQDLDVCPATSHSGKSLTYGRRWCCQSQAGMRTTKNDSALLCALSLLAADSILWIVFALFFALQDPRTRKGG